MKTGDTYVRKLTELQKQNAVSLYGAGHSVRQIARPFGVDPDSIYSLLKRRGVVLRGHRQANRRCALDETVFDTITEESAYWCGMLMADGCITKHKYSMCVHLALTESDGEHVEKFKEFLGSSHRMYRSKPRGYKNSKPLVRLSVSSHRLSEALGRFGVVPRKSLSAKVIGLEENRDFWRGVVDGDGYIMLRPNPKIVTPIIGLVGAFPLLTQFADYVSLLTNKRPKLKKMHSIWNVKLYGASAVVVLRNLYEECKVALDRKLLLMRACIKRAEEYAIEQAQKAERRKCRVCGKVVEAKGLCAAHYKRMRKHGRTDLVKTRWHGLVISAT